MASNPQTCLRDARINLRDHRQLAKRLSMRNHLCGTQSFQLSSNLATSRGSITSHHAYKTSREPFEVLAKV